MLQTKCWMKIKDPENYILQEKVEYAPLIETPDEYAKREIRMMYFYDKEPIYVQPCKTKQRKDVELTSTKIKLGLEEYGVT